MKPEERAVIVELLKIALTLAGDNEPLRMVLVLALKMLGVTPEVKL